jgi:phage/conjugal plasmid C-4 type zinc finger TraR family protein
MSRNSEFVSVQAQILTDKRNRYTGLALRLQPGEINPHTFGKLNRSFPHIERALSRIAAGTYTVCEDCGDPIPEKRQRAVPGATRCISCQEQEDRQHAQYR